MHIQVRTEGEDHDAFCEIIVDGERVVDAGNFGECPEDANLTRGLNFVYGIPDLLEKAYNAGKAGEPLTIDRS